MPLIAAVAACFGSASGKMMMGFLPPKFQRHPLQSLRRSPGDGDAGRDRADEPHTGDTGMTHQGLTAVAVPGQDVNDSSRKKPFTEFAQHQTRKRSLFRTLDDQAIAGNQGCGGLFRAKAEGVVEGTDLGHNSERLSKGEVEVARLQGLGFAFDFRCQSREVPEGFDRPAHVGPHPGDGVSGIDRIQQSQILGMFFNSLRQKFHATRPLCCGNPSPFAESTRGCLNGSIDIRRRGMGNIRQPFQVGRVDDFKRLSLDWIRPGPSDKKATGMKSQIGCDHGDFLVKKARLPLAGPCGERHLRKRPGFVPGDTWRPPDRGRGNARGSPPRSPEPVPDGGDGSCAPPKG